LLAEKKRALEAEERCSEAVDSYEDNKTTVMQVNIEKDL
jgi:hypothetical protein